MANRTDPYKVVIEATVGGNKGKGDIAIDDVVFDKNCIYYDGPYGPTTTTTQKTTTKTTTTQKNTKTTTKSTSSGTTTTPIFTPSPPDGDGSSTVVIVVIVICSLLAISVIAFAVFTLMKRRRQL